MHFLITRHENLDYVFFFRAPGNLASFFDVFFNELMGISIWRMSVFFDHSNHRQHDFVDRHTSKPHFCCVGFCICFIFFSARGYFLVADVGPNECWPFVEYHHYNSATNLSKHDFVDRHTSKPSCFSSHCWSLLEYLDHYRQKKVPHGYFLVAGVGPNDCWVFVEYHHYNFVTISSPILRNMILSTGTRPNCYFLVCFLVAFLRFLYHFRQKKFHVAQEPTKMAQDGS